MVVWMKWHFTITIGNILFKLSKLIQTNSEFKQTQNRKWKQCTHFFERIEFGQTNTQIGDRLHQTLSHIHFNWISTQTKVSFLLFSHTRHFINFVNGFRFQWDFIHGFDQHRHTEVACVRVCVYSFAATDWFVTDNNDQLHFVNDFAQSVWVFHWNRTVHSSRFSSFQLEILNKSFFLHFLTYYKIRLEVFKHFHVNKFGKNSERWTRAVQQLIAVNQTVKYIHFNFVINEINWRRKR